MQNKLKQKLEDNAIFQGLDIQYPIRNNLLFYGDNLLVLKYLLKLKKQNQLINSDGTCGIKLIYIDPSYNTGRIFKNDQKQILYKDKMTRDEYLDFMKQRLVLMRQLLTKDGSIYIQVDYRISHYIKILLDQIFGIENFRNQIIWRRQTVRGAKIYRKCYSHNSDHIFLYSRGKNVVWNKQVKINKLTLQEADKKYMKDQRGYFRTSDIGSYTFQSLYKLYKQGKLYAPYNSDIIIDFDNKIIKSTKGNLGVKYYRQIKDNMVIQQIPIDNIWEDIPAVETVVVQRLNYDTQKPQDLLKRIILGSSNPGDIVADFFCGTGTTLAVAEKLDRKWIGCDNNQKAINIVKERLKNLSNSKDLIVPSKKYNKECREYIYKTLE